MWPKHNAQSTLAFSSIKYSRPLPPKHTLRADRQCARMSKITNGGLTRSDSGTGCFTVLYLYRNSGVKGLKHQRLRVSRPICRVIDVVKDDKAMECCGREADSDVQTVLLFVIVLSTANDSNRCCAEVYPNDCETQV